MRAMNNIECTYILRELSSLCGKHFSKIQKIANDTYRMKIGDEHILIQLPLRLGIAKYISESGEPDNFVQHTKKLLHNQRLLSVSQHSGDRIILFEFEKNKLICELFSKGNILILDEENKILNAIREESWKDRSTFRGNTYSPPPSNFASGIRISLSDKYIIVCLLKLPLGKEYAKELLSRSSIDEKTPGNSLS
ncbi:NFACT family protein [Candidatus Micrarchaeota archaeon]|nr:NFACT family protein [Candidatus Micrarchaeota archaeon]